MPLGKLLHRHQVTRCQAPRSSVSNRDISPVRPSLAESTNWAIERCIKSEGLRSGSTRSNAPSSRRRSSLSRQSGISNGAKRLIICGSVVSAKGASAMQTNTILNFRSLTRTEFLLGCPMQPLRESKPAGAQGGAWPSRVTNFNFEWPQGLA